jgi:hypothetical protein
MVLVTSDQPSKVLKPTDRSLDLPATTVSAERTPILRGRLGAVLSMRADQFDTATPKSFPQRVAVSRCIVDQSPRLALENTVCEQRLYESYFVRTRARRVDAERKTMAVGKDHDLGALATFGLADLFTPFFADENVPSANDSSWLTRPLRSSRRTNRAHAFSQTPDRVQSRWRRQQVVAEGKREGMSFQRAPVRRIQRMPSMQIRDGTTGRPPLGPTGDSGNRSSINCHRSSVSSNSGSILDPVGDSTAGRERFFMSASFRLHSIRSSHKHRLASNSKF